MVNTATRTLVLAFALSLASPALAKQPPVGTASFTGPQIGPLVFSSYPFAVSNTATDPGGGGGGAGKATFSPFTIVRPVDDASPVLVQAAATGQHIPAVTIVVANGATPVTYKLEDVLVSQVAHQGGVADTTETLSFSYAKITITAGP
jgi:type VI protein secretion system component Hcp